MLIGVKRNFAETADFAGVGPKTYPAKSEASGRRQPAGFNEQIGGQKTHSGRPFEFGFELRLSIGYLGPISQLVRARIVRDMIFILELDSCSTRESRQPHPWCRSARIGN